MFRSAVLVLSLAAAAHPAFAQPEKRSNTEAPKTSLSLSQPAPARDPASFPSIVLDLGSNFRRLPSLETAMILGIGGGLSLAVHHEDAQVTHRFSTSQGLDTLLEPGEAYGGGAVQAGAALGIYVVGRSAHSFRVSLLGADLVRSQIMNAALTEGIKVSVGRRRPDGTRFSFPSGHTSSSFATATVLQRHLGWRLGIPAYGLAAFVGGSRMQENKHYVSDVIFGVAIGIVSGRTTTIGRGKATFAVSPFATAGGGGLGFSLVARR
jgi:PAP2 superfamily